MDNRSERIVALGRYIGLLKLEESRLKWVISSAMASVQSRKDAKAGLQENAEKTTRANKELKEIDKLQ